MRKWNVQEANLMKALNLVDLGEYVSAIELLDAIALTNPNSADVYFWKGYAYRQAGLASQESYSYYDMMSGARWVRNNTPESTDYLQKSSECYNKAIELHKEKP